MKSIKGLGLLFLLVASLLMGVASVEADTYVRGYYKKDGTLCKTPLQVQQGQEL